KKAKAMGNETAADFALSGSINSFVDQLDGDRVTTYQVDLKLINMETNEEVWNGQKKLKKLQEKSSYGW
ncbi:MAG: penicillin-binding protein activator LpoB, partial [Bermanella sp.]